MLESSLGVVGACLPLMRPILVEGVFVNAAHSIRSRLPFGFTRNTIPSRRCEFARELEDGVRNTSSKIPAPNTDDQLYAPQTSDTSKIVS